MSHFRLCYRDPNQRFKVVIIEAASLIHARLKATLAAHDGGMIFTEGHELSAEMAPLLRPGRVLSADEADGDAGDRIFLRWLARAVRKSSGSIPQRAQ